MNVKRLAALMLAAAVMTACSDNKDEIEELTNDPVEVQFQAAIGSGNPVEAETRATNTSWAPGDSIGIYMVENGTTIVKDEVQNRRYNTTFGDGKFTAGSGNPVYFPQNTVDKVDFIAYYPYHSSVNNFTYMVNIADQSIPADIDLLYVQTANIIPQGYDKNNSSVRLVFDHQLTKFIIHPTPGEGLSALTGMTVTMKGMETQGEFNLKTGQFDNKSMSAPIEFVPVTDGSRYEALLFPGMYVGGHFVVEFTLAGEVYKWEPKDPITLDPGTEHDWFIKVQKTPVSISATINPWITVKTGNGEAY